MLVYPRYIITLSYCVSVSLSTLYNILSYCLNVSLSTLCNNSVTLSTTIALRIFFLSLFIFSFVLTSLLRIFHTRKPQNYRFRDSVSVSGPPRYIHVLKLYISNYQPSNDIFCKFVSLSRIFRLYRDLTITCKGEGLQNFGLCSAPLNTEKSLSLDQGGIFTFEQGGIIIA